MVAGSDASVLWTCIIVNWLVYKRRLGKGMVGDKWYMLGVSGRIEFDYKLANIVLFEDAQRATVLHRANGHMIEGIMGEDKLLIKKWMLRGQLHRYYGPALNGVFDLEWSYDDRWYIGGREVKRIC